MYAVCLAVQRLDKLGVDHTYQIIEGLVRIRDTAEQGNLTLTQFFQVQFVRHGQLGNRRQVERGKAHTHADQNGFCGFARGLFENAILLTSDAVGFAHLQTLEQDVQRRLIVIIILVDFCGSDHLHDHREVLFFGRSLVQQVQHEGLEQRRFGLFPEGVAAF